MTQLFCLYCDSDNVTTLVRDSNSIDICGTCDAVYSLHQICVYFFIVVYIHGPLGVDAVFLICLDIQGKS